MIYNEICEAKEQGKKLLAILIDPDHLTFDTVPYLMQCVNDSPATHILIGGSLLQKNEMDLLIHEIKKYTFLPLILFPGNYSQISDEADAILFLSLLSGRNAEYLIGQHIHAAPIIKKTTLEVLSTGYILIESGTLTSVAYISNTTPIPRNKKDIVLATALAGEMLGNKLIYLEAGSGAAQTVPLEMITHVSRQVQIPILVGGGIRSINAINQAHEAGATMVVIGTAFENNPDFFQK